MHLVSMLRKELHFLWSCHPTAEAGRARLRMEVRSTKHCVWDAFVRWRNSRVSFFSRNMRGLEYHWGFVGGSFEDSTEFVQNPACEPESKSATTPRAASPLRRSRVGFPFDSSRSFN